MNNNVSGFSLSMDRNETTQECNRHILSESEDISPDLETRNTRPTLNATNICSPLKSDGKPDSGVESKVDISLMENHDDDEGIDVSSKTKMQKTYEGAHRIRAVKTYGRRRKNTNDSTILNSKFIQENTRSLVPFAQNKMGNTSGDPSVETPSSSSTKDVNEKKLVEGQGSLLQVVEDLLEKADDSKEKTSGSCLNKDMPLVDSSEQNFELSERAKPDHIIDTLGDFRMSHKVKECGGESGKISPYEPVDKHSVLPLSDLSNSRGGTTQVEKDVKFSLERSLVGSFRKKLLVLDINGLLADIVPDVPDRYTPHAIISGKSVFRRPFCDDFLQFCFTRFNVGVWSSRMKRNVQLILDFLMGDAKQKLVFCWDQSHCTWTGFNTLENREKPLLVKKLNKLWEKYEENLPWEKGEYNEANTLLLDDSPHKALGNPPYTAIFPYSYEYMDYKDKSLGPGGALRVYLEGLANAENVQKYVKENPFGQRSITERNLSWRFYRRVIEAISYSSEDIPNIYSRVNFHQQSNI